MQIYWLAYFRPEEAVKSSWQLKRICSLKPPSRARSQQAQRIDIDTHSYVGWHALR